MSNESLDTFKMADWIDRGRQGDRSAYDRLLRAAEQRLYEMAQGMLAQYPRVRQRVETQDVLQNAMLRLLRALEVCSPASTREFYKLATEQIRRELLDLAKYFRRRPYTLHEDLASASPESGHDPVEIAARSDKGDLERWEALHEAVEQLPAMEREVFGLAYYHGWKQQQIAELLQLSERQIRRHWTAALMALSGQLQGLLPLPSGE